MYLIVFNDLKEPFYTKWFDYDNNWEEGMTVIDLRNDHWTRNGVDWMPVETDHL